MAGRISQRGTDITFDTSKFEAGLNELLQKAEFKTVRQLDEFGGDVADKIRRNAPGQRLKDGTGHETGRDARGPYVDIYVEPFFASFLEWGTKYIRPRSFYRRGLEAGLRRFTGIFRRLF